MWAFGRDLGNWAIHDESRPKPAVVTPGASPTEGIGAPADAVVLFDGKDLSNWQGANWKVENGYMEVTKGSLSTKEGFGDCQLHIEWMTPVPAKGDGQGRSNSGVYFMGKYELQVLDSFENLTYADGQAGSIYGQYPPLVNASRPPGQWQTYDVVFRRPRFDAAGKLTKPAIITAFHNGILIQDHTELTGPTGHKARPPYAAHGDKAPISLQDHGQPIRFKNIWIRALGDE
jgi:hypothetical protein